jgi:hypothetical protein
MTLFSEVPSLYKPVIFSRHFSLLLNECKDRKNAVRNAIHNPVFVAYTCTWNAH